MVRSRRFFPPCWKCGRNAWASPVLHPCSGAQCIPSRGSDMQDSGQHCLIEQGPPCTFTLGETASAVACCATAVPQNDKSSSRSPHSAARAHGLWVVSNKIRMKHGRAGLFQLRVRGLAAALLLVVGVLVLTDGLSGLRAPRPWVLRGGLAEEAAAAAAAEQQQAPAAAPLAANPALAHSEVLFSTSKFRLVEILLVWQASSGCWAKAAGM